MYQPIPPRPDPEPDPASRPSPPSREFQGSVKLFRLLGTEVFVHWSWFLVAWYSISTRPALYTSLSWAIVEYVAVFGIVLLHEFGHVLGCRSVGGRAERVLLWPLGGLAFVDPPPRPGANLWTTVAGPLVNLLLAPVFIGAAIATSPAADAPATDLCVLFVQLSWINGFMFLFNLLPIFPMDGGRILQAVLWFGVGRAKSLAIASYLGIVAGVAGALAALMFGEWWLAMMAGFLVLGAWSGVRQSRHLALLESLPKRQELRCPHCGEPPPAGPYWRCTQCGGISDPFAPAACPAGGEHLPEPLCPSCGRLAELAEWQAN